MCALFAGLLLLIAVAQAHIHTAVGDVPPEIEIALLRQKLLEAATIISQAELGPRQKPVQCSCEGYCMGTCFAPLCLPCPAGTWSFPGGEQSCVNPFPLGQGLLCDIDNTSGRAGDQACCRVDGPSCQLPPDSCCASGDCGSCPPYPIPVQVFPPLNRTFANNTCKDRT
jgi:hypothetical protein